MTDEGKNVTARYEYDVFGAVRNEVGTSDNVRKFTGKEYESDVKLYYYGARYYDPYIGRFISRDPIGDGLNWYIYVGNNPLAFIDPNGLEPVQSGATTVDEFVEYLEDNKPDKLEDYLPEVKVHRNKLPTFEAVTFDNDKPRYISTEKYGWVDMQHFMGAAAVAADYLMADGSGGGYAYDNALIQGVGAEIVQLKTSPTSAFSYEDLPSNAAGATFGAYHYQPNSGVSLSQQIANFLNGHAGAQGVKNKNASGTWEWVTEPGTLQYLPKTHDSKRMPPRNRSHKPFSPERLKQRRF